MKLQLPTQNDDGKKRVSFNEAELAEHDKERGTRMVIPDPDTPFMRSPVVSDDEESSPQVQRNAEPARVIAAVIQDQQVLDDDEIKRREFEARRKAHYNEFRVVKAGEKSPSQHDSESEEGINQD